jgi:ribosome biogenesis GTPase
VYIVSAKECANLTGLRESLNGKITVLAGPSGVGKSTLINSLLNRTVMETGDLSEKIGRGKHTTRHAEIIPIDKNSYIIDTPGFSSLNPPDIPKAKRALLLPEFIPFLGGCKFSDCLHHSESGCAVKEQVGIAIHPQRYERYLEWLGL